MNQYKRLYVCKLIFALMPHWGGSGLCIRFRVWLLRWAGLQIGRNAKISASAVFRGTGVIKIGDNVTIGAGVKINAFGPVEIGDNVEIGEEVFIQSQGGVIVGNNTSIFHRTLISANDVSRVIIGSDCQVAHMVSIKTSEHEIDVEGKCIGGKSRFRNIEIGNGCWICASATIIPGVMINDKAVVAAGAVVTKDVPSYSLVAGVPAVVKKKYKK